MDRYLTAIALVLSMPESLCSLRKLSGMLSGASDYSRAKPVLSGVEGTPRTQSKDSFSLGAFVPLRESLRFL